MLKIFLISSIASSLLLVGCGGGGSDDTATALTDTLTPDNITAAPTYEGQLIDSYVENVDYYCGDNISGIPDGTTDINGSFSCANLPVSFNVGGLRLGSIDSNISWPADKHIFPQDLLDVNRSDINNSNVVAMARFLQSCDEDGNTTNGIHINDSVKISFIEDIDFIAEDVDAYATDANIELINEDDAVKHLNENIALMTNASHGSPGLPVAVLDAVSSPLSTLTPDVQRALAFMGNEERLAYDVYTGLYALWPLQETLTKIPNNAEIYHIEAVKLLVEKYNLDPYTLRNDDGTPFLDGDISISKDDNISDITGIYSLQVIQSLYDDLMLQGNGSEQSALEVGCMIEVTDIIDLDLRIDQAQTSNADDVLTVFNYLRDGSYSHYWSFNKALQKMGIENGCCVLGDAFCKTEDEYPNNNSGKPDTAGQGH